MNEIKLITMEGETLSALKTDMNSIIGNTLKSMQIAQSDEATVSVKLKISLEKRPILNETEYREAVCPKFEHDVSSTVQIKDKKTGSMTGDFELFYDKAKGRWCMRDINAQLSMFEETIDDSNIATDDDGNQICITAGDDEFDVELAQDD